MAGRPLKSPTTSTPLLPHLLATLGELKRTRIKELLRSGLIHVNGSSVTQHNLDVGPGDRIEWRDERASPGRNMPIPTLFEDASLLAVEKPCGLLTIGTKSEKVHTVYALINRALAATRERAYIVHRLDRYTSGVLLLAKSPEIQDVVMRRWKAAEKTYYALVEGEPKARRGTLTHFLREDERLVVEALDRPLGAARKSVLRYEIVDTKGACCMLRIRLETGRKNQIRAQMAAIGHPIAGDAKYGARTNPAGRLCLHAASLSLPHPATGRRVTFESPVPF